MLCMGHLFLKKKTVQVNYLYSCLSRFGLHQHQLVKFKIKTLAKANKVDLGLLDVYLGCMDLVFCLCIPL